ncbi:MAG: ribosomal RNA small subunit methyltransferase A [Pyrinomonadaceae bacterium]|jgi:16S rRNA (adenine1518-N6/adenine1519-N6)-dimethyltransferase|nr:MAG: ribosomal RNA small subunit methyltransferase A [Pyrinomonadaceae bacterium]
MKLISAKKSFGQNFLISHRHIQQIVSALSLRADETIIEIGSGCGALTEPLIELGANVIAIELERNAIDFLKSKFPEKKNFTLIEADVLKINFSDILQTQKAKLVGNLPFYISTAILQKLIPERFCFEFMVLMFQREVAERLLCEPKNSNRGFLSVVAQTFFHLEKLFDVPPSAFRPVPKVWSSVLKITPKEQPSVDEKPFCDLVGKAFSQKRKTLFNNLKNFSKAKNESDCRDSKTLEFTKEHWLTIFQKVGIDPSDRAEALSNEKWLELYREVFDNSP